MFGISVGLDLATCAFPDCRLYVEIDAFVEEEEAVVLAFLISFWRLVENLDTQLTNTIKPCLTEQVVSELLSFFPRPILVQKSECR